jgi:hypothetical protein
MASRVGRQAYAFSFERDQSKRELLKITMSCPEIISWT